MAHALVTGSSRGIGRAIAQALARRGDRVVVHYSGDRAGAEQTLASLDGAGHALVAGDLGDPADTQRLAADALDALGHLDILVNNAGVAPTAENAHPVDSTTYEHWQAAWMRMAAVNLLGASNLSMLVAQAMVTRGQGGTIVNVGSRGAFRGEREHPAYAATKAGLQALGQSLALTLAPHGISVTSVAPGMVATERQVEKLDGPEGDGIRGQSPFGRVGTPEEIAAAVAYLTSPDAVWASGSILDLNGASYFR